MSVDILKICTLLQVQLNVIMFIQKILLLEPFPVQIMLIAWFQTIRLIVFNFNISINYIIQHYSL